MPFFGTVTERAFREKSKAQEHIQMMHCCALDFFPAKRARWQSRVLDFFRDSRIRVKHLKLTWCRSAAESTSLCILFQAACRTEDRSTFWKSNYFLLWMATFFVFLIFRKHRMSCLLRHRNHWQQWIFHGQSFWDNLEIRGKMAKSSAVKRMLSVGKLSRKQLPWGHLHITSEPPQSSGAIQSSGEIDLRVPDLQKFGFFGTWRLSQGSWDWETS